MDAISEYFASFSGYEIVLLSLLALSAGHAAFRGLTESLLTKLGLFVGLYLAFFHGGLLEPVLIGIGISDSAVPYISPVAIVAVSMATGWLASVSFTAVLKRLHLKALDHALGFCYGFLRFLALILVGTVIAARIPLLSEEDYKGSIFLRSSGWILKTLSESESTPAILRNHLLTYTYAEYNRPVPPSSIFADPELPLQLAEDSQQLLTGEDDAAAIAERIGSQADSEAIKESLQDLDLNKLIADSAPVVDGVTITSPSADDVTEQLKQLEQIQKQIKESEEVLEQISSDPSIQ